MNYVSEGDNCIRYNQRYRIAVEVSKDIEVGSVKAIATHGEGIKYYLVEFTGTPYADQTGEIKCDCYWLYESHMNLYCCYHKQESTVVRIIHVVDTDVQLEYIIPSNMPAIR